jgi:LuxR family maltose regulon positive regulatory protein
MYRNDTMGLRLDAEAIAVLEERTEGWIAGLQLAALSLQGREDFTGVIQGFAGTQRFIMDYLLEEVLTREPLRPVDIQLAFDCDLGQQRSPLPASIG